MRPKNQVSYDFAEHIIIVSGGARGIGNAISTAFLQAGATVICADVSKADNSADGLPNRVFMPCDVADPAHCQRVVRDTVSQFGRIDVLVNNAAIQPNQSYVPVHELPAEILQKMLSVNFGGYHHLASYSLAQMKAQQSGVVINIASGQAHRTARQVGVYGPIKSANVMQARQWAVEYARDGIRVLSVSPGAIDTPMVRASLEEQGGAAALANRHPIGRIGKPEEVAAAVLWLSSTDASFVTGTDLEVDGGLGAFGAFADPF